MSRALRPPVVNFSLRREVMFVAAGSAAGGAAMHLLRLLAEALGGGSYLAALLVAARVAGSDSPAAGLALHFAVATAIGVATGAFLHGALRFDISSAPRGVAFGLLAGAAVFAAFAVPVSQLLLVPNLEQLLVEFDPSLTPERAAEITSAELPASLAQSLAYHLAWGAVTGAAASALTARAGASYRCYECDVEFARMRTYAAHREAFHEGAPASPTRILVLGGGYAGVGVLRAVQRRFEGDAGVSISMASESNFFLHTPMLPELATGSVEARHIATPIRAFCRRARFYQARAASVDLDARRVALSGGPGGGRELPYDYLVLAVGSRTNFFGNREAEEHSLTMRTLGDAVRLRNRVIGALEDADQEPDPARQAALATFVVVGGGFSGVETAGELNDFVRESAARFYRNIDPGLVRVVLVASGGEVLPEAGRLGAYARESLEAAGVTVLTGARLAGAGPGRAVLEGGREIPCSALVWAGGVEADPVVAGLDAEHGRGGRVLVDEYLRLRGRPEVFALGDCALASDPGTGEPYPPTAQHAARQAAVAAANLACAVSGRGRPRPFSYAAKGTMAKIGRRNGVALLMGRELRGAAAWLVWKQYYLSALPTAEKRVRVALDWLVGLLFPRDITRL